MTAVDFQAMAPLLVLGAGAVLLMIQIAVRRGLYLTTACALVILLTAALSCSLALEVVPHKVTALLQADRLALLFSAVFCLAGAVTVLLSADYLQQRGDQPEEYFLLILLSTTGACVLVYASHFASLFLGLELMAIALYALVAYPDRSVLPLEAAIKYLVLSGASTATLLFGFALLYSACGALDFAGLAAGLRIYEGGSAVPTIGAAMVFAGLAFKLSLVPFHLWTADVYEGAPAPVTGFLASVSKAAAFLATLRLLLELDLLRYPTLIECTALIAIFSMLVGNLLALKQVDIKRMLAFSSIAHMGYLLIVVMATLTGAGADLSVEASAYYLVAYTATTLAAFALLTVLSPSGAERERVELGEIAGLFWQRPLTALLMMVAMLSLAGIPLTAGFIAKFYLFNVAVAGGNWILLATLIIGSGLGIYYYLRVIYYMTRREGPDRPLPAANSNRWHTAVSTLLIVTILWLGVLPQPLMTYLQSIL